MDQSVAGDLVQTHTRDLTTENLQELKQDSGEEGHDHDDFLPTSEFK